MCGAQNLGLRRVSRFKPDNMICIFKKKQKQNPEMDQEEHQNREWHYDDCFQFTDER